MEPLYKGQWSISIRDRLDSGASLQGTVWTVEPLYKGQVGQWSLSTRDSRMCISSFHRLAITSAWNYLLDL